MKFLQSHLSLALGALTSPTPSPSSPSSCAATTSWPGSSHLKYAFIFGDSYTTTDFNYTLTPYPSPHDPLGNPTYPGHTASNGPNWVDYLTVKYNESVLLTYNLAYGGATLDSNLVEPFESTVLSVKEQILDEFVPGYVGTGGDSGSKAGDAPGAPDWNGGDTLFAVWIGINDVGNSYPLGPSGPNGTDVLNGEILAEYAGLVDVLYEAGGRNFLFVNVPPVNRSPLTTGEGEAAEEGEKADIAAFNGLVVDMAESLKRNHSGEVNVWVYDANSVFNEVLDSPKSFPQTSGYKNTTGYCEAYENGTSGPDSFNATCGIPVNEYFWLNELHPTYPMHDVVAQQMAKALNAGPNICAN